MSRLLVCLVVVTPLLAQTPAQTPDAKTAANVAEGHAAGVQEAQAAPPTAAPAAPAAAAESPVPSTESWLTGSIDLGERWRTGVAGSMDTYRTLVNLGSGPKLIGTEFTLTDPQHRFFDVIRVRAYGWGGDPNETFHLDARKSKLYDFSADYRDFAYFNDLPSYADPLASRGILLDEQSFDTRRHLGSFRLDLLPGNWIVPYVAFERDSSSGMGATTFVSNDNEYPVPNTLRDLTNLYRGGVRVELRKFHATLEGGGSTFRSDQSDYQNGGVNPGNNPVPYLGQTLDLTNLLAAYGIRGDSKYAKALVSANLTSWLDFYGQFLYSEPNTTVNYQQTDSGSQVLQSELLFYTSQQFLLSAAAKLPHTSGSAGVEIRPMRRLRIIESWLTDRLHDASSANSTNLLLSAATASAPGASAQMAALLASSLATNYSQEEVDAIYEVSSKLTVRGGYRYVWGDANDATLPAEGLVSSDQAKLRRNVGMGAFTFRPARKLSFTAEAEAGLSSGAYFQTSLYDYQKVRAQARYQATGSLSFAADFLGLNNQDPQPGVKYDYLALQESLSLLWSPGKKLWDFEGSYSRSALRSDIGYLDPGDLGPEVSRYRDNAHTVTALFNLKLMRGSSIRIPKLTAGGSMFVSSGSRPTSYYQPLAKLWVPLSKHTNLFAEWTYYGYGEAFYLYEGFRTHVVTAGVRFMR